MSYDTEQVGTKLLQWREFMQNYHLPTWEELPDLELYMDQVVALVSRYVNLQPHSAPEEYRLTPSAVNNYVRLKLIPPPVKKRYGRVHLCYLIVICSLKSSLSLSSIQRIFPMGMSEKEVEQSYGNFLERYRSGYLRCLEQMTQLAQPVLETREHTEDPVDSLVMTTAVAATLYKLVTEKLLALQLPGEEEKDP